MYSKGNKDSITYIVISHGFPHTCNVYHYQLRKCRRTEDIIKRNKLLDPCINNNGDLFEEIKKPNLQ